MLDCGARTAELALLGSLTQGWRIIGWHKAPSLQARDLTMVSN